MEIKLILEKLEQLGQKEIKDFYLEIQTDCSSVIKIIDEKDFFIHANTLEELESIVNELTIKGLKQFILDNNNGSYKVHIPDDEFEKLKQ